MSEVTRILSAIEEGDPAAAEKLLPLVYDELRKLAAAKLADEKPGQTLQATALVHEAYLRLVASSGQAARSPTGTVAATSLRRPPKRCGASSSTGHVTSSASSAAAAGSAWTWTAWPRWTTPPTRSCWRWMRRWSGWRRR